MNMLALERRNHIVEKLQDQKKVYVSDLAAEYGVSEETIRRDLDRLDREGIATKSYGGAVFNETAAAGSTGIDLPFNVRRHHNAAAKQRIADLTASLIQDGDHIMLDASTTAIYIAKAIKQKKNLTVVTNSIEIILELSDVQGWNIIASGGSLKGEYLALTGPGAIEGLSSFNVEKAILSCKGLDLERGITEGNELFAQTKQAMMRSGARRILTADSSKFGKVGFSRVCKLDEIDMIITDTRPDSAWLEYLRRNRIEVLYPGMDSEPIL